MHEFISYSEDDTKKFARALASLLKKGDIIILSGNLGSGKTKFTEGVLDYFGKAQEISSPTFTIVNEHQSDNINIYHFDVYRLADIDEFYSIGGEEYFDNGICIIEWGELIESILPENYLKIDFKRDNDNISTRTLKLEPHGTHFNDILERIVLN